MQDINQRNAIHFTKKWHVIMEQDANLFMTPETWGKFATRTFINVYWFFLN